MDNIIVSETDTTNYNVFQDNIMKYTLIRDKKTNLYTVKKFKPKKIKIKTKKIKSLKSAVNGNPFNASFTINKSDFVLDFSDD